jgi:Nucleoside 2-deoxyribosyltransferase
MMEVRWHESRSSFSITILVTSQFPNDEHSAFFLAVAGVWGERRKGKPMPDEQGRPYVYLAGPDVFYPEPALRAKSMKDVLAARGMIGWFPLDSALDSTRYADSKELALAIGDACEAFMRRADICMARARGGRRHVL